MHIEQAIIELTHAVTENTNAVLRILALAESTPIVTAPKAKKEKPAPEYVMLTSPPTEPEPTPEPEHPAEVVVDDPVPFKSESKYPSLPSDRQGAIDTITMVVKGIFAASGTEMKAKKDAFEVVRKEFGVAKVSELTDDKLAAFYDATLRAIG